MIGTKVRFYIRAGEEAQGTITAIEHREDGGYPIITIEDRIGRTFTRSSDDVTREVSVTLFMDMPLSETDLAGAVKEIVDSIPSYYGNVADWEYNSSPQH